jgi:hypothetical protein
MGSNLKAVARSFAGWSSLAAALNGCLAQVQVLERDLNIRSRPLGRNQRAVQTQQSALQFEPPIPTFADGSHLR